MPGVTEDEVVVGMSAPLTGPAASWGSLALAARAWAEHRNRLGGVGGRRIRVLLRDDGYLPERARANLGEMRDSVLAVLGTMGSAVLGACRPLVAEARLPWIYPLGNPRILARPPREEVATVFAEYPDYADEAEFLVRQAARLEGAARIGFFGQDDDYGQAGLEGVVRGLASLPGASLASAVRYRASEPEVGPQALALRRSGADAVLLYATPAHAAGLVREMAGAGYRPRIFASFTLSDRDRMFELLGDLWEGAYFGAHLAQRGEPAADRVLGVVEEVEPGLAGREGSAIHGVAAMMVLIEGLERAGRGLDREGLVRALESLRDWSPGGLSAPISFGPDRHHGLNGVRLLQALRAADRSFRQVVGDQGFPPRF